MQYIKEKNHIPKSFVKLSPSISLGRNVVFHSTTPTFITERTPKGLKLE